MEDTAYFCNSETLEDSSAGLKTLIKKHYEFLCKQKKIKVTCFALFDINQITLRLLPTVISQLYNIVHLLLMIKG